MLGDRPLACPQAEPSIPDVGITSRKRLKGPCPQGHLNYSRSSTPIATSPILEQWRRLTTVLINSHRASDPSPNRGEHSRNRMRDKFAMIPRTHMMGRDKVKQKKRISQESISIIAEKLFKAHKRK